MTEPQTIAGADYMIGKLSARAQLHVARRIAPMLSTLVPLMKEGEALSMNLALPAIAEQLAAMTDTEVDYVVDACLAVCQRQSTRHAGGGWGPVVARNGAIMFDDIDMPAMMQLVAAVIAENLGNFFGGLTPGSRPA